jgi:hypothetical protein
VNEYKSDARCDWEPIERATLYLGIEFDGCAVILQSIYDRRIFDLKFFIP